MWCASCRSDVAAEVTPDHRHVRCANCGSEISATLANRTQTRTRQARELLERWSRERTVSPGSLIAETAETHELDHWDSRRAHPGPVAADAKAETPPSQSLPGPRELDATQSRYLDQPVTAPTRKFRIDAEHQSDELMRPNLTEPRPTKKIETDALPSTDAVRTQPNDSPSSSTQYRVDAAHGVPAPHITITAPPEMRAGNPAPSKWVATIGQSLAYVGVLGLMAGTCLVILGYFRGPASYAPTGWLITMAGQMLLFLGVVTLISSGMEETTNTVAERIDRLGEKLIRIEQATASLRGPRGPFFGNANHAEHAAAEGGIDKPGPFGI